MGYGQVHEKIRTDSRLVLIERTNLRDLHNLPDKVDLVTIYKIYSTIVLGISEALGKPYTTNFSFNIFFI